MFDSRRKDSRPAESWQALTPLFWGLNLSGGRKARPHDQANPPRKASAPGKSVNGKELTKYVKPTKNDLDLSAGLVNLLAKEAPHQLPIFPSRYAGLRGTGSTCFAFFDNLEDRKKTLQGIAKFIRDNNCRSVTARSFFDA